VVLVVPAHPLAFGPIDKAVGHYRRYTKRALVTLLRDAGLAPIRMRHFNPVGLIGWLVNAKLLKVTAQRDAQIKFFDTYVVPVQQMIERIVPFPFGQSLLGVAIKKEVP